MNKIDIKNKIRDFLFEGKNKKIAAGVLIKCEKTDKILLLLRSSGGVGGNTWNLLAGGIHKDEEVLDGLKREVTEEISIDPEKIEYKFKNKEFDKEKNLDFHYYTGLTKSQFKCKLCDENVDWGWFSKDDLPSPLFPNLIEKIDKIWEN